MKRLLFLFLLFMLNGNSFGQNAPYVPFPEGDAVWNVYSGVKYGKQDMPWFTITYFNDGDTVINSVMYKKINHFRRCNSGCSGPLFIHLGRWGYYRNDTALRTVYRIDGKDSTFAETVWYNFNLSVGDSVHTDYWGWKHVLSVTTDTSTDIKRNRYNLGTATFGSLSLVEGIGLSIFNFWINTSSSYQAHNPLPFFVTGFMWQKLPTTICYSQDGNLFHPMENVPSTISLAVHCENPYPTIVSGIGTENLPLSVTIYPNPVPYGETLVIEGLQGICRVMVYDLQGRLVKEETLDPGSGYRMDMGFGTGLYFLKISDPDGKLLHSGKILVE